MTQLRTMYLGLELAHPIVASASPLARTLDGIVELEQAGAAAIVLPSIYQEEIEREQEQRWALLEQGALAQPEASGYFLREASDYDALEERLTTLRLAVKRCRVPLIASLNGSAPSGWTDIAQQLEQAGAAALELNLYRVPARLEHSGQAVEQRWLETVRAVCSAVAIPVSVKLSPWLSSPGHFVQQLGEAGAAGAVLFNRFYHPDVDLQTLEPQSTLNLSSAHEIRFGLLWMSLLAGRVPLSLGASTGVETHVEVVKYLLAGADVVMTTSALLRRGTQYIAQLRDGLAEWMRAREFRDVSVLRGRLAHDRVRDPEPLLRAQYAEMLQGGAWHARR